MLVSGIPMKIVSEILGHSTITITADLYTHVLADSKKIAANQLSDFVFGKKIMIYSRYCPFVLPVL